MSARIWLAAKVLGGIAIVAIFAASAYFGIDQYRKSNPRELAGHDHAVLSCAIIPKSDRIATMCYLHVRICTRSGKSPIFCAGHSEGLTGIDCSPDGKILVSVSKDGTMKVWDTNNGNELQSIIVSNERGVTGVAFHPAGKTLATISNDGSVRFWDSTTWKLKKQLKSASSSLNCVTFSESGDQIAVGTDGKGVEVWKWEVGDKPVQLWSDKIGPVLSVAFDSKSKMIASGGKDKTIRLWNLDNQIEERVIEGHWGKVNSLRFSPDGNRLVSGSSDFTIAFWNVADGSEIKRLPKQKSQVMCLDCDFSSDLLLSGGYGPTAKLWRGYLHD